MSTTLPNGVVIYDAADNLTPVHTTLAVLAGSLSDAIGGSGSGVRQPQIFTVADETARGNLSTTIAPLTLTEGDIADQRDTDVLYRWSGSAWVRVDKPGLIPIIPTSVSGTGVTVGATGLVSLSATTNADPAIISGAFLSQFKQVKILMDLSSATGFGLRFRLRSGATTNAVSYYRTSHRAVGTTPSATQLLNQADWELAVAILGKQFLEITLTDAAAAAVTHAILHTESTDIPMTAAAGIGVAALQHNVSTAFDGFVLTPTAGTVSGTVAIYGYSN